MKKRIQSKLIITILASIFLSMTVAFTITSCATKTSKKSIDNLIENKKDLTNESKINTNYQETSIDDNFKISLTTKNIYDTRKLIFDTPYLFDYKVINKNNFYKDEDIEYRWFIYNNSLKNKEEVSYLAKENNYLFYVHSTINIWVREQYIHGPNAIEIVAINKKTNQEIASAKYFLEFVNVLNKDNKYDDQKARVLYDLDKDISNLKINETVKLRYVIINQEKAEKSDEKRYEEKIKIYDSNNQLIFESKSKQDKGNEYLSIEQTHYAYKITFLKSGKYTIRVLSTNGIGSYETDEIKVNVN